MVQIVRNCRLIHRIFGEMKNALISLSHFLFRSLDFRGESKLQFIYIVSISFRSVAKLNFLNKRILERMSRISILFRLTILLNIGVCVIRRARNLRRIIQQPFNKFPVSNQYDQGFNADLMSESIFKVESYETEKRGFRNLQMNLSHVLSTKDRWPW